MNAEKVKMNRQADVAWLYGKKKKVAEARTWGTMMRDAVNRSPHSLSLSLSVSRVRACIHIHLINYKKSQGLSKCNLTRSCWAIESNVRIARCEVMKAAEVRYRNSIDWQRKKKSWLVRQRLNRRNVAVMTFDNCIGNSLQLTIYIDDWHRGMLPPHR